jgi:hypothetical protein
MNQIPVYLFTGFLDAGKTRFIRETLEDPSYNEGFRWLNRHWGNVRLKPLEFI